MGGGLQNCAEQVLAMLKGGKEKVLGQFFCRSLIEVLAILKVGGVQKVSTL